MKMNQLVLTTGLLVLSSSIALAGDPGTTLEKNMGGEAYSTQTVNKAGSAVKEEKLGLLESKLEDLEARINGLFPKSSSKSERYDLEKLPYDSETVRTMQGWDSEAHLLEAKANQQTSENLENKIQKIQDRIDRFNQKPYLDPKGFKRSGLEILKGKLVQDHREADIKTAWHKAQVEKILLSESKDQKNS